MTTIEERVSHLEGAYTHLATKADLSELKTEMSELRGDLTKEMGNHLKWMIGFQLAGLTAVAAIVRFLT